MIELLELSSAAITVSRLVNLLFAALCLMAALGVPSRWVMIASAALYGVLVVVG